MSKINMDTVVKVVDVTCKALTVIGTIGGLWAGDKKNEKVLEKMFEKKFGNK